VKGLRTLWELLGSIGNFVSLSAKDPKRLGFRSFPSTHTASQAAGVSVFFEHTHYIAVAAAAAAAARSPTMATQMSKKRKVCYLSTTGLRCKFLHKKENLPWLFFLLIMCFC
jgi:hypothetical protein